MKKRILILFTLLGAAISSVQSVHAATITVTNLNDSGPGSLRQALADANSGDEINFSVTGTITLTSGELAVSEKYVTISGPGANLLAVSRPNTAPCFPIFRLTRGNCLGGGRRAS